MTDKSESQKKPHPFSSLPAFDDAMQKLVRVPKEAVEALEKQSRTPRPKK